MARAICDHCKNVTDDDCPCCASPWNFTRGTTGRVAVIGISSSPTSDYYVHVFGVDGNMLWNTPVFRNGGTVQTGLCFGLDDRVYWGELKFLVDPPYHESLIHEFDKDGVLIESHSVGRLNSNRRHTLRSNLDGTVVYSLSPSVGSPDIIGVLNGPAVALPASSGGSNVCVDIDDTGHFYASSTEWNGNIQPTIHRFAPDGSWVESYQPSGVWSQFVTFCVSPAGDYLWMYGSKQESFAPYNWVCVAKKIEIPGGAILATETITALSTVTGAVSIAPWGTRYTVSSTAGSADVDSNIVGNERVKLESTALSVGRKGSATLANIAFDRSITFPSDSAVSKGCWCVQPPAMYMGGNENPYGHGGALNGVIWKITLGGTLSRFYPADPNTWSPGNVISMETDDQGTLYAVMLTGGTTAHTVFAFNPNGTVMWSRYIGLGTSGSGATAVVVSPNGTLWVAVKRVINGGLGTDWSVYLLDKTTGQTIRSLGGLGFFGVDCMCCDYRGRCYIATRQNTVWCFDTDGTVLWVSAVLSTTGIGSCMQVNVAGTELMFTNPSAAFSTYVVRLSTTDGSVISTVLVNAISHGNASDFSVDDSRYVATLRNVFKDEISIVESVDFIHAEVSSRAFCRRESSDLNFYVSGGYGGFSAGKEGLYKISPEGEILWHAGVTPYYERTQTCCGDRGRVGAFGIQ